MTNSPRFGETKMNHLQFRVAAGTIAVTWNSHGLLSRMDWYDNGPLPSAIALAQPAVFTESVDTTCIWSVLSRTEIPPVLANLVRRLRAYFHSGEPVGVVPLEILDTRGWSEFQRQVYQALARIPHGETRTYSWVAAQIGKVDASRAVGQALRRNPFPILVPCHRIVAANALGGFMGITDPDQPELKFKRWLLELENSYLNPYFSFFSPSLAGASEKAQLFV